MTAELITHTDIGFPISGGASKGGGGAGMVWGIYEATSTEDDDWVELSDFDEIKFCECVKVVSTSVIGTVTTEPVTIHQSTSNRLVFSGGSTNVVRILVIGTRGA